MRQLAIKKRTDLAASTKGSLMMLRAQRVLRAQSALDDEAFGRLDVRGCVLVALASERMSDTEEEESWTPFRNGPSNRPGRRANALCCEADHDQRRILRQHLEPAPLSPRQ